MNQVAFGNQGTTTINDAFVIFNGGTIDNGPDGSIVVNHVPLTLNDTDVTNAGSIALQSTMTGQAALRVNGEVTFEGGGVLTLDGPVGTEVFGGDRVRTDRAATGIGRLGADPATLVNQNHTIEGTGMIGFFGMGIENRAGGVIDANVSGAALVIAGLDQTTGTPGTTNLGTLQASDGGILRLFQGIYDQGGAGGTGMIQALDG